MNQFEAINREIHSLIEEWKPRLSDLPEEIITQRKNLQNRSVKQIVGHMIDSASNNTHRIIHLQYQTCPLIYPDYANLGNNDRWIAIQDYQSEDWDTLTRLWEYSNLHLIHVISRVNTDKLENEWITALNTRVSLKTMIIDYPLHLKLHLLEIEELIK